MAAEEQILIDPTSSTPPRVKRAGVVDLLVGGLVVLSMLEALAMVRLGMLHGNDFKHLWAGAWLLSHGMSPYDPGLMFRIARQAGLGGINPYVYLPTTGLMLNPLALLPFAQAVLAWFWFNWALAWTCVFWGPSLLRVERPAYARLAGAAFLGAAFPFYRQMTAGQMNVVTVALVLWAAAMLARKRPVGAGLALGLGFAWKISPALLIGAMAGLGRWRVALWGVVFSVVSLGISVGVCGWDILREVLPVLRQMGYGQSTWAQYGNDFFRDPFNQSPNALLHHLLTVNPYTRPWVDWGPQAANMLTVAISLIILGLWMMRAWSAVKSGGADRGKMPLFLAATLAMLLLPSLMWDHYCVQALPALLWIFGQARTTRSVRRGIFALAIFAMMVIPWFHAAPAWREGPGILLMSIRLWPVLALYGWLLFDPAFYRDTLSKDNGDNPVA